ncbi:putative glycosyl transferase [Shimia thalassica]|uniref:Putative glycosyl transferase n=1 Tax=Shimia thalassica TaxID=1715693 RepID=A0A0P1IV42_9RHOB|nr:glycosyltransferase family 2 protein [Shimia thalassica]CUK08719.1 putative glycosyl transferase [Shimia thalassica]
MLLNDIALAPVEFRPFINHLIARPCSGLVEFRLSSVNTTKHSRIIGGWIGKFGNIKLTATHSVLEDYAETRVLNQNRLELRRAIHSGNRMQIPTPASCGTPRTAILLATYNGATNLQEQLDSIASQSIKPDLVLISDDGSKDKTQDLVKAFMSTHPDMEISLLEGPCKGAARNFLHLVCEVPDWIDFAAFSDQDDVWLDDKTERSLRAIERASEPDTPILFCGRTWVCDKNLNDKKLSQLRQDPSFKHALVQNIAGGNTMTINRAAIDLLQVSCREARKLVIHDWWAYQIITGVGGTVLYDPEPLLLYRQHEDNVIGANNGLLARIRRMRYIWKGRFRYWNTLNIKALNASAHRLTSENREILRIFEDGRNGGLLKRIGMVHRTGIRRQGLEGKIALYVAAILRKL